MKLHSVIRAATAGSLLTGIMLVYGQAVGPMGAQLTSHGSTAIELEATIDEPSLHYAAAVQRTEAGQELAMGALFIVLGFVFHALLKHREERRVHITVVPKKAAGQQIDKRQWYWMHLHV